MFFPGVGQLIRNKAGRMEFTFEAVLVEALELGLGPVSTETWGIPWHALLNSATFRMSIWPGSLLMLLGFRLHV